MPIFNAAEIAALKSGGPRIGLFFRLNTVPVIRLWMGVGNIAPGVNSLDPIDGGVFRGLGEILDWPVFQQLCDGTAERVEFTLSGIPPHVLGEIAALLSGQQAAIAGKTINVGYALMGPDWQLLGPVKWQWDGFADFLRLVHPVPESADDPDIWTLQLSAGSWLTGRKRPGLTFFTQADQGPRSLALNPGQPVDRFCERTPLYSSAEVDKVWPDF